MAIYSGADRTRPYIGRGIIKSVYQGADLIWKAEQALPDVTLNGPAVIIGGRSGTTDSAAFDIGNYNTLSLNYNATIYLRNGSDGNGKTGDYHIYLVLSDNTLIQIGSGTRQTLYYWNSSFTYNGSAVLDLSNYTQAQKTGVKFRATLATTGTADEKYLSSDVTFSNIIAS